MFPQPAFPDYALLDSGGGEKLERWGAVVLRRPDPQALWHKRRPDSTWEAADLAFERDPSSGGRRGDWRARSGAHEAARGTEPHWTVDFDDARFRVRPTPFKHVGLFPEQASNWQFVRDMGACLEGPKRLLNLFGYTGAASVLASRAGFEVTHVDASKTSLAWTVENLEASGLQRDRLRLVLDDALAFTNREVRRGARYEGILLDPPHYGRGPKGQKWQFEDHIAPLLGACAQLLAERAFLVLSTYAIGFSPTALANLLADVDDARVEAGELGLAHDGEPRRWLPAGFCARLVRGLPPAPGDLDEAGAR